MNMNLKGTGFSPYIKHPKTTGALAPEGTRISKSIFAAALFAALLAPLTLPAQQEKPWEKIPSPNCTTSSRSSPNASSSRTAS